MTPSAEAVEFDLCGPLPAGVTVLEASAGTGKTYTIAGLAARYVAGGIPLDRLLLITFTRMATGELRDRVRERLVSCERGLADFIKGKAGPQGDEIVALLSRGTDEELARRHERLARAVSDFDGATIATTHGFCQEILAELGTIGDLDPETAFVEDTSSLLEEVLDDLYVLRFHSHAASIRRAEALKIATAAVDNPSAELEPRGEPQDSTPAMRWRLAERVRAELERRKRQLAIMTYDDLLTRLRDTLDGPNAALARERLRARFDVVLVDEFQDTDPVQWQILQRAFDADGVTLVLIADPKQAIYAFRGADVFAYLTAAATARTHATLRVNRRTDQPLLDAYDALFGNARLGHEGIAYRRVRAAPAHRTSRLIGAPRDAPLQVRVLARDEPGIIRTPRGFAQVDSARAHIARDVAGQVVELLASGAQIEHRAPDGGVLSHESLSPGHIAVLVRRHRSGALVRDQLVAAGVPAVMGGAESVFVTKSATDWLRLLEALELPASSLRARTAALTPFLGWDAEALATRPPHLLDEVHRRLHRWARILREDGTAALLQRVMADERLPARMLAVRGGERRLTDLRHLAELLHRAASTERLGVTALRSWLAERIGEAEREGEEERTRRLESDSQAVQILTIHRSKGLEFPVVMCPFLWESFAFKKDDPVAYHDPAQGYRHKLDVGLGGREFAAHARQHCIEERGEDLRLAYVALTRAKHRAFVWWAGAQMTGNSALARLLFSRDEAGNIGAFGPDTPTDAEVEARLSVLAASAEGRIAVERAGLGLPAAWSAPAQAVQDLAAARFDRALDPRWRRTSYSAITAGAHDGSMGVPGLRPYGGEPLVASEPEQAPLDDEPGSTAPAPAVAPAPRAPAVPGGELPSPLAPLPVGTEFGTLVHRVLEAADFAAADLGGELRAHIEDATAGRALVPDQRDVLAEGLRRALETPLGPVAGGLRLCEITRADRLDELEFELPLAGGEEPRGEVELAGLAAALRDHLPPGDLLRSYTERLADPALADGLRGYLTGSIDAVLRLERERFAIVDYKTNWLGAADEPLTLSAYEPAALRAEMSRAHYVLQALLYTVALHRYLRWRLPGYDPERNLAGVLYLFLRGMAGPDTPLCDGTPFGVFAWRPPGRLVQALSDVLSGDSA